MSHLYFLFLPLCAAIFFSFISSPWGADWHTWSRRHLHCSCYPQISFRERNTGCYFIWLSSSRSEMWDGWIQRTSRYKMGQSWFLVILRELIMYVRISSHCCFLITIWNSYTLCMAGLVAIVFLLLTVNSPKRSIVCDVYV